jgi:hypothetical protein
VQLVEIVAEQRDAGAALENIGAGNEDGLGRSGGRSECGGLGGGRRLRIGEGESGRERGGEEEIGVQVYYCPGLFCGESTAGAGCG